MAKKWSHFFSKFGPGFVTGASDDDPSGIATYAQAGAGFGFGALWIMLFSLPFMIAVQEMAGRVALVTGRGLVPAFRARLPRLAVFGIVSLLVLANAINIGADLGMMASALNRFLPVPFWMLLLTMTVFTLALQIFLPYRVYARYLKWLTLSLFAYVAVAFFVHIDWVAALRATVIPSFPLQKEYLLILVALLGTTISPYLSFWQAGQEIEEEVSDGHLVSMNRKPSDFRPRHLRAMRLDVGSGMFFSNTIAWFIILTTGVVLFRLGGVEITSADQAARVLEPLVGQFASSLFALGVIGTGLLAVPVLSGTAAYAVSEVSRFREGLSRQWSTALGFYGVIVLVTLVGVGVNVFGINPVRLLIYAAIANAIIAPPVIVALLLVASDERVMGSHRNTFLSNCFGWGTVALMAIAPAALLLMHVLG